LSLQIASLHLTFPQHQSINMADGENLDPRAGGTEATANKSGPAQTVAEGKGKEKAAPPQDVSMDEDESDEDEDDSAAEGAVSNMCLCYPLIC